MGESKTERRRRSLLGSLYYVRASYGKGGIGHGGLRKARFTTRDSECGKSGAYRVFYAYFPEHGTVLLWAIIAKSETDNLTKADRNAIAKQLGRLKHLLDQGAHAMNKDKGLSPLGAEMVAGLSAFCDALESGEAIEKRFTVRTVQLDLRTKAYGPGEHQTRPICERKPGVVGQVSWGEREDATLLGARNTPSPHNGMPLLG